MTLYHVTYWPIDAQGKQKGYSVAQGVVQAVSKDRARELGLELLHKQAHPVRFDDCEALAQEIEIGSVLPHVSRGYDRQKSMPDNRSL